MTFYSYDKQFCDIKQKANSNKKCSIVTNLDTIKEIAFYSTDISNFSSTIIIIGIITTIKNNANAQDIQNNHSRHKEQIRLQINETKTLN